MRINLLPLGLAVVLAGCAGLPPQQAPVPDGSTTAAMTSAEALRATQVFVYPSRGQGAEQLDRDRYECYQWAVEQTGFDPSQVALAPHQRVEIVAMPTPGTETAVGAVTGAVVGAAVSRHGRAAEGAIVGAVIGGLAGAASEAERARQAEELRRRYDQRESAWLEQQSNSYRRALSACLEGRGYTIK